MAVICKKCGGPHPMWDCKATPAKVAAYQATIPTLAEVKGATAALERAFPSGATSAVTPENIRPAQKPRGPEKSAKPATSRRARVQKPAAGNPQSDPPPASPKSKGGRPKLHPDRKKYRADKAREYRLKKKAAPK